MATTAPLSSILPLFNTRNDRDDSSEIREYGNRQIGFYPTLAVGPLEDTWEIDVLGVKGRRRTDMIRERALEV